MKSLILAFFIVCSFKSFAQTDTTLEAPEWYYGDKSFSLSIKKLQTYFTKPTTLKQFEKTLDHYQRQFEQDDTTYYPDTKTFKVLATYYNLHDKSGKVDNLYITFDPKQKVTAIRFVVQQDQLDVDKLNNYIVQLKNGGYTYDLRYSRMSRAFGGSSKNLYFKNSALKVFVTIHIIDENRFSVEVS
jgi:hypothetical protein